MQCRFPSFARPVQVVVEVRTVAFDDRMRLMDVLFPHERRDLMTGVLGFVQGGDTLVGGRELLRRSKGDGEGCADQRQNDDERATDADGDPGERSWETGGHR
jgi:hypothetical protein